LYTTTKAAVEKHFSFIFVFEFNKSFKEPFYQNFLLVKKSHNAILILFYVIFLSMRYRIAVIQ